MNEEVRTQARFRKGNCGGMMHVIQEHERKRKKVSLRIGENPRNKRNSLSYSLFSLVTL